MTRGAAVAAVTLTTLLTSACSDGIGVDATSAAFEDVRAVAAEGVENGAETSSVTSVGACLAGARQGDDSDALAEAVSRYGVAAFDTFGSFPSWTDRVDCAQPHEIEVYAIVTLPDAVERDIVSYASLVDPKTHIYRTVDEQVAHACADRYPPAAAAAGASPLRLDVVPVWTSEVDASFAWAPAPPSAWSAGDHTFACLFVLGEPGTTQLADVASAAFPDDGRICLMRTEFVACGRRHDAERIATVIVDRAVHRGQLRGAAAVDDAGRVNLGLAAWRTLDTVCQAYLDAAAPHHAAALHGVADTYPELYPDPDGRYVAICAAQAPFGTARRLTSGSVFD
jgi:hypothetical protein